MTALQAGKIIKQSLTLGCAQHASPQAVKFQAFGPHMERF